MKKLKLELYWKISLNEYYSGKHWSVRSGHKTNYRDAYVGKLKELRKFENKVDIEFDFTFKSRALDSSNCSAMVKLLEDCMVKAGVIQNDSPKFVGWISMKSMKGLKDSVTITIKENNDE